MFLKGDSRRVVIGCPGDIEGGFCLYDSKIGGKPLWLRKQPEEYPFQCKKCKSQLPLVAQIYNGNDAEDRVLYVFGCTHAGCLMSSLNWTCILQRAEYHQDDVSEAVVNGDSSNSNPEHKPSTAEPAIQPKPMQVSWGVNSSSSFGWSLPSSSSASTSSIFSSGTQSLNSDVRHESSSPQANHSLLSMLNQFESKPKGSQSISKTAATQAGSSGNEKHKETDSSLTDAPTGIWATGNITSLIPEIMLELFEDEETKNEENKSKKNKTKSVENSESNDDEVGDERRYEKDESLSLLLKFKKALKSNPDQVIRIAHPNGCPLFPSPCKERNAYKPDQMKKNQSGTIALSPIIPKCSCGYEREFELQLLPTLHSFLNTESPGKLDLKSLISESPEWSSLLVFTCTNKKCTVEKQFVSVLDPF